MAARLAHKMAIEFPRITADVVEVSEYPELGQRYRIYGVPKTVVNDEIELEGAVPEAMLIDRLLAAYGDREGGDGTLPVPGT